MRTMRCEAMSDIAIGARLTAVLGAITEARVTATERKLLGRQAVEFAMQGPTLRTQREPVQQPLERLEEVMAIFREHEGIGDKTTVTVHVRRLREKIEADPGSPARLTTVWGVGYRWNPISNSQPVSSPTTETPTTATGRN